MLDEAPPKDWISHPVESLEDCAPYAYSNCVQAGPLVFVAGQCGLDDSHEVVSHDFLDQSRRALERIEIALAAADASLRDVVSMTVFVTDVREARLFTDLRRDYFDAPYPASAVVEVSKLIPPGARIEVQAVAWRPTNNIREESGV